MNSIFGYGHITFTIFCGNMLFEPKANFVTLMAMKYVFYCNDNKITEFDMINTKNSSTAYVVIYKLIT